MPKGTRVHDCVDNYHGSGNKYAVCQASTHQSFQTGKPLKESRVGDVIEGLGRTYRTTMDQFDREPLWPVRRLANALLPFAINIKPNMRAPVNKFKPPAQEQGPMKAKKRRVDDEGVPIKEKRVDDEGVPIKKAKESEEGLTLIERAIRSAGRHLGRNRPVRKAEEAHDRDGEDVVKMAESERLDKMTGADKKAGPLGKGKQQEVGAKIIGLTEEAGPTKAEGRLGKFADKAKLDSVVKKAAVWSDLGHVELHDPSNPNKLRNITQMTHESAGKILGGSGSQLRSHLEKNPGAKIPHPEIPGAHFQAPAQAKPEGGLSQMEVSGGGLSKLGGISAGSTVRTPGKTPLARGKVDRPFTGKPAAGKGHRAVER